MKEEEEKNEKSEAEVLPNCNRGSFPAPFLLLALYLVQLSVSFSSFSFLKS